MSYLDYSPSASPRLSMLGLAHPHPHSPFLALAAYASHPHASKQPAHFHLAHQEAPVPPSILRRRSSQASASSASSQDGMITPPNPTRRTSTTPSLCHSSSSSLASLRSPSSPFTPVLSGVDEDDALVVGSPDEEDDTFSSLDPIALGDSKNRLLFGPSPAKVASPARPALVKTASVRPALVRRDTPIPPRSSVPDDGRRLARPSEGFTSTLKSEPDMAKYTFLSEPPAAPVRPPIKRRDTPRPTSSSFGLGMVPLHDTAPSPDAWLQTLSSELVDAWRARPETRPPVFHADDEDEQVFQSVFESDSESEDDNEEDIASDDEDATHDHLERWRHGVARAESGRPQSWTSVRTGQVWVAA